MSSAYHEQPLAGIIFPHLEIGGTNWSTFQMRFKQVAQATHKWRWYNRTKVCPVPKAKGKSTDEEAEAIDRWEGEDQHAKTLLLQRLPDSMLM